MGETRKPRFEVQGVFVQARKCPAKAMAAGFSRGKLKGCAEAVRSILGHGGSEGSKPSQNKSDPLGFSPSCEDPELGSSLSRSNTWRFQG